MKRFLLVLVLALTFVAGNLMAKEIDVTADMLLAQYNEAGDLSFSIAASMNSYGISPVAGAEFIIGSLDFIPDFPMEWGVGVKGIFDLYFFGYSGFGWSIAPVATIHKGINAGPGLEFDVAVSMGLGLYGYQYSSFSRLFNLGFATFETVSWKLNDSMWIIVDYGYIGWQSVYGLGVKFPL